MPTMSCTISAMAGAEVSPGSLCQEGMNPLGSFLSSTTKSLLPLRGRRLLRPYA